MPKEGVSKWQRKSTALNRIRWELDQVFNEDFEQEEKDSAKYLELVECAYGAVDHSVPEDLARGDVKMSKWYKTLWYSIAVSGGAIIAAAVPYIPDVYRYIAHFFQHSGT